MGRNSQCRSCGHPDRRALDAALAAGDETLAELAFRFGLTKSGLDRHWQRHAGPAAAAATKAVDGVWQGRPIPTPKVPVICAHAPVQMCMRDMAPGDAARVAELRAEIARLRALGGRWGSIGTARAELAEIEARSDGMAAGQARWAG